MKRGKDFAVAVAAVVALYAVFHITGIGCPIKFLTGISCAGCGMTRACFALASLDVKAAVGFHPLVFVIPAYIAIFFLKGKIREGERIFKFINSLCIILFLAVYIVRLINPHDSIVVFDIKNGLIFKVLKYAGGIFNG